MKYNKKNIFLETKWKKNFSSSQFELEMKFKININRHWNENWKVNCHNYDGEKLKWERTTETELRI